MITPMETTIRSSICLHLIAIRSWTKMIVDNKFYLQHFNYALVIFFRHTERMAYVSIIVTR